MQVGDAVAGNDVDGGSLADTITQRLNDVSGDSAELHQHLKFICKYFKFCTEYRRNKPGHASGT